MVTSSNPFWTTRCAFLSSSVKGALPGRTTMAASIPANFAASTSGNTQTDVLVFYEIEKGNQKKMRDCRVGISVWTGCDGMGMR